MDTISPLMNVADRVAEACLNTYKLLPAGGGKPQRRSNGREEWTILAGCVIETRDGGMVPIALATGVKCTPYEKLSAHGDVLRDCHAEVLTRRALRAWLLERLILEARSPEAIKDELGCVLAPVATSDSSERWSVRDDIHLHWYISTLPCALFNCH